MKNWGKKFPWSMIEAKEVGLQVDCILVALNKQRSTPSPWLLLVFNYSILLGRRGYISSLQFLSLSHGTCLFKLIHLFPDGVLFLSTFLTHR